MPKTRVDGEAPIRWSRTDGGDVFNGKIEGETTLYAVEYAPVIEFDSSGGSELNPLIARAGSTVALPVPVKELAQFVYWEDMNGHEFESTVMPSKSVFLKAVWQAKLIFDENGGSEVNDISLPAGDSVTLPMPEREGFIFAGWYTADKQQYSSKTMPSAGLELKAGWYKEQSKNVVVISSSSSSTSKVNKASITSACYKLPFDNYSTNLDEINIRLSGHFKIKSTYAEVYGAISAYMEIYSQQKISSSYLIARKEFAGIAGTYRDYNFEINLTVSDDIYLCIYHGCAYTTWSFTLSDFYYTVFYPDTTNLYL